MRLILITGDEKEHLLQVTLTLKFTTGLFPIILIIESYATLYVFTSKTLASFSNKLND